MNDADHFTRKYQSLIELEPIFKAVRKVRFKRGARRPSKIIVDQAHP